MKYLGIIFKTAAALFIASVDIMFIIGTVRLDASIGGKMALFSGAIFLAVPVVFIIKSILRKKPSDMSYFSDDMT